MSAKFQVGAVTATLSAVEMLDELGIGEKEIQDLLDRHTALDKGVLCEDDHQQNVWAAENGERIHSVFSVGDDQVVWVVTQRDRSVTTIMLPGEDS